MGDATEFERITIMLPCDALEEATDLAAQIGVPTARLLAELLPAALSEARTEWRMVCVADFPDGDPAEAPTMRFSIPPRVK